MPTLAELTWSEIEELDRGKTVVFIPVGAIEQHGPHLPLNTDVLIAEHLAEALAKYVEKSSELVALLAPALSYTYAKPSTVLPGTISVNGETFIHYVRDIIVDLRRQGFKKFVFVNSHYENTDFLLEAGDQALGLTASAASDAKIVVAIWWEFCTEKLLYDISGGVYQGAKSDHAATIETAIVMAAAPEVVRMENLRAADDKDPLARGFRVLPWDKARWPKTGVFSVASKSTPEMGRQVIAHVVGGMGQFIRAEFD